MNAKLPVYDTDILNWLRNYSTHRSYYDTVQLMDDNGWPVVGISTWETSELALEDVETDVYRLVKYFNLELYVFSFDKQGDYVNVYIHLYPESRTVTR